jgi:uncharacterized membrane protein
MAINYTTGSGSIVSNPSEGGSFNNEATGELSTALTAANAATLAKIAAALSETNALASENAAAASAVLADADRVTTNADVVLTNADVVLAEADKVQTGLDRVATNADVVLTHADVVLAEADKVQTALDRIATAADKVATNADVVLTNADVVLAEADKVQTGLDRVATGNDKTATNADVVLTNADVVLAEADKVQTGLDRIATAADKVATNADVVLTHADVVLAEADKVQTALDRISTTASADTSAGNAAASLATFTGQYVSQSSQPGSPGTGDLWFDTTNNIMKVYNGTNWVNAGSSVNGVQNSVQHIATAGQTTFAATYDITYLQVYLNGGLLASSDYTATNGTSIVLAAAAFVNDIVFIHSFGTFLLADHYSKVAADARYSTITYVDNTVSNLVDSAPATLNTLNELAAALGDDASFSTTVATNIAAKLPLAGGALTGAVTTNSTFDGRDVATDGTKLDGIETSATADQTGAQIKTAYQAETNAFTDAQFTKLGNIEANATADQTGAQIKTAYQAETNAFTDAQFTKLAGVATGANNYTHPANHAISVITGLQTALDNKANANHNHNTLYDPIGASVAMAIALGG